MTPPPVLHGSANPQASLDEGEVRWLLLEYPYMARARMTHEEIAWMMEISPDALGRLLRRETYPDVEVTDADRERWARERPDVRWEGTSRLYDPDHLPPARRGEDASGAKLPEAAVRWLDRTGDALQIFLGFTLEDLADSVEERWGVRVTPVCIGDVLRGRTWTHVTGRTRR